MVRRVSILALALCLILNVNALAVTPRTETTSRNIPNFSVTGNTAHCSLRVASPDAKASITATVTLLKSDGEGGFTVLYRWAGVRGTGDLDFVDTYTSSKITGNATYRMEFSVHVVGSYGTDNINNYLEIVK